MEMEKKVKPLVRICRTILDTVVCVMCYVFIIVSIAFIGKEFIDIAIREPIIRYYICGMLFVLAAVLSIVYIESYNKKYFKNDSDSSKRQNDLLFESDIYREEGRYSDRRDVE